MPNWATLPDGVIALIARLLETSEFISFRGTCTSWRLATSYKDFQKKWCPGLPFLMINRIKDNEEDGDDGREFFNFYKGKVITISLPEIKNKVCIGTKGWFITIGSEGDMCLLNPVTRVQIHLPNISDESYCWVKRAVLSSSPTRTSKFVLMIVYLETPKQMNYIGFWKPEDPAWTKIKAPANLNAGIQDVIYHNGKFYALSYSRQVWMLDVFGSDPIIIPIQIIDLPSIIHISTYEAFFMEYEGTLLVVSSFYTLHRDCSPHRVLELVEVDVINGTCTKITSLGDKAVFIGNNEGFCVDAMRFPGVIRPNYLYLSNGSYQLAGCQGRMDISPSVKAGMFCCDTHSTPSSSNYCNVWVTPNL